MTNYLRLQRLIKNITSLFDGVVFEPCLLHGDLWSDNISYYKNDEPLILDSTCYYGHKEANIPTPIRIYRSLRVTEGNMDVEDLKSMLCVLKLVVEEETVEYKNFEMLAVNSSRVVAAQIVGVEENFQQDYGGRSILVVAIEMMDRGSLYNMVFDRFDGCVPEPSIIYVLFRVLKTLAAINSIGETHGSLSLCNIFLNSKGDVKLGYGASIAHFYDDCCLQSWEFLQPTDICKIVPPEALPKTKSDIDPFRVDVWRFGVVALELSYGGLRLKTAEELHSRISTIVEKKKLPKLLEEVQSPRAGITQLLHALHLPEELPKFPAIHFWVGVESTPKPSGPLLKNRSKKRCEISKGLEELVLACLNPDPLKRPEIEEMMELKLFQVCCFFDGKYLVKRKKN